MPKEQPEQTRGRRQRVSLASLYLDPSNYRFADHADYRPVAIILAAVEEGGGDAVGAQRRHLVLHQRNQRRHHQRQPAGNQRRQLVAQRLAAAGGHHHQAVPPGQGVGNYRLLAGAEGVVPEMPFQHTGQVGGGGSDGRHKRTGGGMKTE